MMLIEQIANGQEKVASRYIARETARRMRMAFKRMRVKAGKPKKDFLEYFMTPEGAERVKAREMKRVVKIRKRPGAEMIEGGA